MSQKFGDPSEAKKAPVTEDVSVGGSPDGGEQSEAEDFLSKLDFKVRILSLWFAS